MRFKVRCLFLAMPVLLFSGCATVLDTPDGDFRVENAYQAMLGSVGKVEGKGFPWFPPNRFKLLAESPKEHLELVVRKSKETMMSEEQKSKIKTTLNKSSYSTQSDTVVNYLRNTNTRYYILWVMGQPHTTFLNKDHNLCSIMAKSEHMRTVTSVVVAVDFREYEFLNGELEIQNISPLTNGEIELNYQSNNETQKAKGAILGYQYDRACWLDDGSFELETDYTGVSICPDGKLNPKKGLQVCGR